MVCGLKWGMVCAALGVAGAASIGHWVEKTTEFKLANGLHVVVLDRASSSGVSVALLAKAGWADDPPGRRGVSALVAESVREGGFVAGAKGAAEERKTRAEAEALIDKWDAEMAKPEPDQVLASRIKVDAEAVIGKLLKLSEQGAFAKQLESVGGSLIGAQADAANTVVQAKIPAGQIETFFSGMTAWLQDPSWRGFYAYRRSVVENHPSIEAQTALLNLLAAKAFAKHAWGEQDISTADLAKARIRDVAAFHRWAFAPGNLVLVVVGDISAAVVKSLAEKHFGTLTPQPARPRDWTGREEKPYQLPVARRGFEAFAMGYRRSPLDSPDDAVLDVIGALLTFGPNSFLQTSLVDTRKVAAVSGALSYPSPAGGGLLSITATPIPGQSFDDLRKTLQTAIDQLAESPLPEDSLLASKRRLVAAAVKLLEQDGSAADFIARNVASLGSAKSITNTIQQIEGISPAEIQRVAKKYLRADNAVSVTWAGDRP